MRLIDLGPRWCSFPTVAEGVRFYFGVSFLNPMDEHTPCPTCGNQRGRRLAVSFWPPIDPDGWIDKIAFPDHSHFHKRVSGETFDPLTIFPSIGLDPIWHGTITNGEATPSKS